MIKKKGYQLFIEFNNSYGLKQGAIVNFKGMKVGYVKHINMQLNRIVVLVVIQSSNFLIPRNSMIETNQVGLFNDVVIDIIPLEQLKNASIKLTDPLSQDCLKSSFLCSNFYLRGYRGLNYGDLIRATTRITQRFDDPRFFKLFYVFLHNSLDIADELLLLLSNSSFVIYLFIELFKLLLL